ncbi:heterokaryon incompatibility protein-domain-containing protein [Xylaria sp. FL1042]|nr:heterokaryon incompatibility protein-domain-containing protein [Xylaria sp. FL1042]
MRLIVTKTLELVEPYGHKFLKDYAILSHTWEDGEVTFQDWKDESIARKKPGFDKIDSACAQAVKDGLEYLWVDTNCIDKTSSAELSEAINSMFEWYQRATVCYAYLCDVDTWTPDESPNTGFKNSRWFKRGWTLQELLAPKEVVFYARDWSRIGTRAELHKIVSDITTIDTGYLTGERLLEDASISMKMSWLSRRETTRLEDMAYCMLGIFDINMPLLYGEGPKAFMRLQEEIIKVSNDQTIFTWTWTDSVPSDWVSMLAPCPETFKDSGQFVPVRDDKAMAMTYTMTNAGLSVKLPLIQTWSFYGAVLDVQRYTSTGEIDRHWWYSFVPLRGFLGNGYRDGQCIMERAAFPPCPLSVNSEWELCVPSFFVRNRPLTSSRAVGFESTRPATNPDACRVLLVFNNIGPIFNNPTSPPTTSEPNDRLYLLEKFRFFIDIQTHPRGMMDVGTGMVTLAEGFLGVSGTLVRLGFGTENCCVFFLGQLDNFDSEERLPFCRVLGSETWGKQGDEARRQNILRDLWHRTRDFRGNKDRDRHISPSGCCVSIGHSGMIDGLGDIYIAQITYE